MSERRQAFLEAALICSRYGDTLGKKRTKQETAYQCAHLIEREADKATHFYPPGKRVIDIGQDSENRLPDYSVVCAREPSKIDRI